jgi:phage-related protein
VKIRFYETASGRSPVEDFLHECSKDVQGEFLDAVSLLEQGKVLAMPLSRNLSSVQRGLHELRFRDRGGQVRVFYFLKKGDAIYMVHAMKKKTQTLPKEDVDLILRRLAEV